MSQGPSRPPLTYPPNLEPAPNARTFSFNWTSRFLTAVSSGVRLPLTNNTIIFETISHPTDKTRPKGLPIDEYKATWEYADVIDFGF